MVHSISSKLPDVGTTIFTVMSQLAAETGALNLSQGFPGFEPPRALVDRIDWHLRNGANQYAPMPGVPALRRAIADKTGAGKAEGPSEEPLRLQDHGSVVRFRNVWIERLQLD